MMQPKSKVTPFLWFNNQAEEAVKFYVSIFANSRLVDVARWGNCWVARMRCAPDG